MYSIDSPPIVRICKPVESPGALPVSPAQTGKASVRPAPSCPVVPLSIPSLSAGLPPCVLHDINNRYSEQLY